MSRVTAKPWFGRFGWRIFTRQGRFFSAVLIAALVGALAVFYRSAPGLAVAGAIMVAFLIILLVIGEAPGQAKPRT
jgi:hypothetical protein